MDIATTPGSKIITVSRAAFARPDTDFLCFGESDVAAPQSAHAALKAALDAGQTRYADVRGLPALRHALAAYLSAHHATVAEARVQVTGSGMAATHIRIACLAKLGQCCTPSPRRRRRIPAHRHPARRLPPRPQPARHPIGRGTGGLHQQPQQSHGLDGN
jgi:hypothetical protein